MTFQMRKTGCLFLLIVSITLSALLADDGIKPDFSAVAEAEFGIDSLERRFIRPRFRFDFHTSSFSLFADVSYLQRMGGDLKGEIDFWLMFGLKKNIGIKTQFELRLNHMCRHQTLRENPGFFDLNEILAKIWFMDSHFKLGIGGGGYTGATAGYKYLFTLDAVFSRIFGTEISFRGQFRLVDCEQLLHEVEIFFNLDESTDLFIRNTRYYESENRTYIGIRARSEGKVQRYIDSLKLLTGFFPYYRKHKLLVCGQFRFVFFKTPSRRVNVSVNFIAPILRDSKLFGDFFPDEMVYPVALTYERKINESLFIGWYGRYYLNLPLDKEQEFDSSLGTGVMLRNQRDFDRINKKTRFEVAFGYNFKHHVEVDAKLGVTLVKKKLFKLGSNLEFSRNKEKSFIDIKLFADDGEHVTLRPFIGYSWIKYHRLQRPSEGKFILGIGLYRWFR